MRSGAAIVFAIVGCAVRGDQVVTNPRRAAEAGVLTAVVDVVVDLTRPAVTLVVSNHVVPHVDTVALAGKSPLWLDFVRHMYDGGQLPGLSPRPFFQMVGPDFAIASPVTDTALIALSSVGLSPSLDEAVVYVDHSCGGRCGSTALYSFRRAGDGWVMTERKVLSQR